MTDGGRAWPAGPPGDGQQPEPLPPPPGSTPAVAPPPLGAPAPGAGPVPTPGPPFGPPFGPPAAPAVTGPPGRPRPAGADRPRSYPQLLRGPDHRWWRPLLALVLVVVLSVGLALAGSVAMFVGVLLLRGTDDLDSAAGWLEDEQFVATPAGFLLNNLLLAALIPAAMVAIWAAHRWRPRWLASVRPGLRWGWMAECAGWSLAFVGGLLVLGLLVDPEESLAFAPEKQIVIFTLIVLLTTPLQAAGEEYAFRGLLTQSIGSWFSGAVAAAVVSGGVTALLFALAHGSQSPLLFVDRLAFGVTASYLVWRTGGLEAGIALHTVNNLYAIGIALATGTLAESLEQTDYPAPAAILDIVLMALFAALVSWRARRRDLQRVHDPALQPDAARDRAAREAARQAAAWARQQAWAQQQAWGQQQWPPPAAPPEGRPPTPGPPGG